MTSAAQIHAWIVSCTDCHLKAKKHPQPSYLSRPPSDSSPLPLFPLHTLAPGAAHTSENRKTETPGGGI